VNRQELMNTFKHLVNLIGEDGEGKEEKGEGERWE